MLVLGTCFAVLGTLLAEDSRACEETLKFHVQCLDAIPVPPSLAEEKRTRLDALRSRLEAGIRTPEECSSLYVAVDVVRNWLWQNASERPHLPSFEYEAGPTAWILRTQSLALEIKKENYSFVVRHGANQWRFEDSSLSDLETTRGTFALPNARRCTATPLITGYAAGVRLDLEDFPAETGLRSLTLTFQINGTELMLDIAAEEEAVPTFIALNYPRSLVFEPAPEAYTVLPRMQGALIPSNYGVALRQQDFCNSRLLNMPWWGYVREGAGLLCMLETDEDAGITFDHAAGGPTRVTPRWYASLGKLAYLRRLRMIFLDSADYVILAKNYRDHVMRRGDWVNLQEKMVRTPKLSRLPGRAVYHVGALYHFFPASHSYRKDRCETNQALLTFDRIAQQLRAYHQAGAPPLYVHLDGWGYYGYDSAHPDVLPPGWEQGGWEGLRHLAEVAKELGDFFVLHDQYRDFYWNAVSYDERLSVRPTDGKRIYYATWCGGWQTFLSPRFAPEYVRRTYDTLAENGVTVDGAYLDVFSVVPLEESTEPGAPVTRRECARYRRAAFSTLRARGFIVSSEEPTDYAVPDLDLVHHGPYYTAPLEGGTAFGIPVPLWNLVYHDALFVPWSTREDRAWGIPTSDSPFLHCLLNAGLPYIEGREPAALDRVRAAADLNARCGALEMIRHELLDSAGRVQRATYADGTQVTVDFDAKTYSITPPK